MMTMRMRLVQRSAPTTLTVMMSCLVWLLVLMWAQQTGAFSFLASSSSRQQQQAQQHHYASSSTISSFSTARRLSVNPEDILNDSIPCSSSSAGANDAVDIIGRRNAVASIIVVGASGILSTRALSATAADATDAEFAAIAARATEITKVLDKESAATAANIRKSEKTAYDFELPIAQENFKFQDVIRQVFYNDGVKVKAIVVVNIKQDDPIARKCIPELISIATKYGGRSNDDSSAIAIICCPTDQGYFEPDTSALIRLKLASEYGYGINPTTIITDKMNLLGTGAHPFWRWLESTSRTPAGLGRIQGNFEKFLIDGRTGLPVRRYPRRYAPLNMVDDIEAVIAGRPLPPARANWLEEWRVAAAESERDTYRFEKGLNWFDQ